jgi:hypothetical protein
MRIPACDGFQETLLYCLDTLDIGSYLLETGLPKAAKRLPGDLTSVLGQKRKSSWPMPISGLPLKADIRR